MNYKIVAKYIKDLKFEIPNTKVDKREHKIEIQQYHGIQQLRDNKDN